MLPLLPAFRLKPECRFSEHLLDPGLRGNDDGLHGTDTIVKFSSSRSVQSDVVLPPTTAWRHRENAERSEKADETTHGTPGFLSLSTNPLCLCIAAVGVEHPMGLTLPPNLVGCRIQVIFRDPAMSGKENGPGR